MSIKVTLIVPIKGKEYAYVHRDCDLPIPPFIGLTIGSKVVTQVLVCQGCDNGDIEVHCQPVEEIIARALCKHGPWELEVSE